MEIKHDESYLYLYKDMEQTGFTITTVGRLRFQGYASDNNSFQAIQNIKDWLEENYKMYQYKDNGVKYGEHELFFWHNEGDNLYFTIDFNDKNPIEYNKKILTEIIKYVENNYANTEGCVSLQYREFTDWKAINDYIETTEFKVNNIPYNILRPIIKNSQYTGDTLSISNREKLNNIEQELLQNFVDKKVIYNGIKGTLKQLNSGIYGVFKPRATRTYYTIGLGQIIELKIA